ncbi:MAG: amino acid--tRNA ligase-related protein [bacterium]
MAIDEVARLDAPTASGRTRREVLRLRQRILATLRAWLDAEDFFAAEVPLLIRGACPDVYLASFVVPGGGYLTTSTEYLIKRLVAGGFERVYTLAPNFRAGEVSTRATAPSSPCWSGRAPAPTSAHIDATPRPWSAPA